MPRIGYACVFGMLKDIVLCVDDEPIVLRTYSIFIERAGFRVAVAENGAAGLEMFRQQKDEICLVLSDIVMPAMNGIEMAESILQIDSEAKILLMSGYIDDVLELQGRKRFAFIRKPFIHAVLIERIRSLIRTPYAAVSSM